MAQQLNSMLKNINTVKESFTRSRLLRIAFKDTAGTVIHGQVTEISGNIFSVFVEEKQVVIHCHKSADGALACHLNSSKNPFGLMVLPQRLKRP